MAEGVAKFRGARRETSRLCTYFARTSSRLTETSKRVSQLCSAPALAADARGIRSRIAPRSATQNLHNLHEISTIPEVKVPILKWS
jgi:hypothetical protein